MRVRTEAEPGVAAPRLSYEVRDEAGLLLAGGVQDLAGLGWDGGCAVRFDVDELPLADGRFHLRLGLADESGEHLYHQLDDALAFVVYPAGEARGLVRLEGRWSKDTAGIETTIGN
jgi:hypothetical protein